MFLVMMLHAVMAPVVAGMTQMATLVMQLGPVMCQFVTLFGNPCGISLTLFMAQFASILVKVAHTLAYSMLVGVDCLVIMMDITLGCVSSRQNGYGKNSTNSNQSRFKHCGISCKWFM